MAEKRQQIVESAVNILHSRGYESTSIQDILAAAQIGKGQFYHYFSSKEELGLAVVDHCFKQWQQRVVQDIFASDKDPKDKISEMLECVLRNQERNDGKCGCFFGNLSIELSEHNEVFRQRLNRMFEEWIDQVKIILDEIGETETLPIQLDSRALAQAIVAMLEGGILLMKNRQDLGTLVEVAGVIKKMVNI